MKENEIMIGGRYLYVFPNDDDAMHSVAIVRVLYLLTGKCDAAVVFIENVIADKSKNGFLRYAHNTGHRTVISIKYLEKRDFKVPELIAIA